MVTCRLLHHGAAANSSPKVIAAIPNHPFTDADNSSLSSLSLSSSSTTQLVYASHLMINVAERHCINIGEKADYIWNVVQTLRTSTSTQAETATAAANVSTLTAKRVVTCVKAVTVSSRTTKVLLVCGFSDGSLTTWLRDDNGSWKEQVLPDLKAQLGGRSTTDLDGVCSGSVLSLIVCTSGGAYFLAFNGSELVQQKHLIQIPCNVCRYQVLPNCTTNRDSSSQGTFNVFLVGTAAPRHNKIHVLITSTSDEELQVPIYCGSLLGHEDWITSFDWITPSNTSSNVTYLASGSQDAKIRLWKWVTTTRNAVENNTDQSLLNIVPVGSSSNDDDEEDNVDEGNADDFDDNDDDDEAIEGEARLEIVHDQGRLTTFVYLEALLVGHEEMVTSVAWHPNPQPLYQQDLILVSASMDRTVVIWSNSTRLSTSNSHKTAMDGVWTPISRVGSAGGILGGSIGSSLLGYLNIQVEPKYGRWIMGHAYGGTLHFYSCETSLEPVDSDNTVEEQATMVQWSAQPCMTGHFDEVTDLCWEAHQGEYLLTVGIDQTCRSWAPTQTKHDVWIEIARPQVHGYNLSAVASLSTADHRDLMVTGADEKEIRVFDGTLSFLRMLEMVSGKVTADSMDSRVERAYIPALGLTNKATAADGADEDTSGASKSNTSLLLERDLGSTSVWPELRKLFGHNSEIARLTSTLTGRTCLSMAYPTPYFKEILMASTTKARDVATANIWLWNLEYRCVQILKGGHRSTVTALAFSPDGTYLASSGKDRRLCIWKRKNNYLGAPDDNSERFFLAAAVDSSHKRIVWSVHFCPFDPTILASGSRDCGVKLWKLGTVGFDEESETEIRECAKFVPRHGEDTKDAAVTSLAFGSLKLGTATCILAVGFEDGLLQLWSVPIEFGENSHPTLLSRIDPNSCHIGAVNKIAWKPTSNAKDVPMIFASCSADCGCRIFSVKLPDNR
jgi:elongator complex protein 2